MRTFLTIWSGQVVSLIGSGMTSFALGVWVYQTTGAATPLVLVALFNSIPTFVLSPLAGALVDRLDRRAVMIAADLGAALVTLGLLALFANGQLEMWHLYVASFLTSIADIFQRLAYQASITMLVPKEQFSRANALVQTGESFGGILSPVLAGLFFGLVGVNGIFVVDFVTFFAAVGALALVRFPKMAADPTSERPNLLGSIRQGVAFLKPRPGLIALALFISLLNLLISSSTILATPMILSIAEPEVLGLVQAASSVGLLLGGLVVSAWGGPKRKVLGICLGAVGSGLGLAAAGLRADPLWIAAGMFLFLFPITLVNASIRAIIQTKVPAEIQGRVFSLIFMLARASVPIGFLFAGSLADRVFEPAMATGGGLANSALGILLGIGAGRGIGLMFLMAGVGMLVVTAILYAYPRLRRVEAELADAAD